MESAPTFDYRQSIEYIETLLRPLPPLFVTERDLVGQKIQPTVGHLAAALLDTLVRAVRPTRILEIGTSFGFSACVLGRAAAEYGGKVLTYELNPSLAEAARQNVHEFGLDSTVDVRVGNAREAVPALAGSFGLILQYGGKDDYLPLLDPLVRLLEPRGLLVTDDVMFPVMNLPPVAEHWQKSLADYNAALKGHPQLTTVWLPIGDGVAISVKNAD
jgi:predicted O-methyltransferase YrrM